ncbi:MAG: hypothetical protein C0467_30900 [Planctomycetaceae bacterium]|nr:hypothetical protein [Planctomycetaceae bacterium]
MSKKILPPRSSGHKDGTPLDAVKKRKSKVAATADPVDEAMVDERLQLVNDRQRGTIEEVSVAEAAITSLHGILLDFDPDRLLRSVAPLSLREDPKKFWMGVIQPWLERSPVLAKAKVVASGRGLHVIVRMSPAVEFETEADHQKWAAAVKVVQKLLPTDPDCPGITALTRPVGSINGKNGKKVRLFHKGEAVSPDDVLALCKQAVTRPFATVAGLLFGVTRITPCPVCEKEGSRLDVLDHVGMCYGGCGKVSLGRIFDLFLKPRAAKKGVK